MFNNAEVMKSARIAHEHFEFWIQALLSLLSDEGIDSEQASLRMAALLDKMTEVSEQFPPPIV